MSYHFYLLMHLLGVGALFFALGGMFLQGINADNITTPTLSKPLAAMHGIALLLILVGGFGMAARLSLSMEQAWIIGKVLIWVVLGAIVVLPKRFPKLARPVWFVMPFFVLLAAWLAVAKPGA